MHRLAFNATLAAMAVVAALAWYHRTAETLAQAASEADGPAEELPLAGLATPTTPAPAVHAQSDATPVLTPSCSIDVDGACQRLAAICDDLAGTMGDTRDGTRTCTIRLD